MGESRGAGRGGRGRFLSGLVAGALLAGLVVAVPAPAGAHVPDLPKALPGLMGAMVVDAATQQVFVSLYDVGEIAVLDFDGNLVKTITGEPGARGLAVSGNHLYVVAYGAQRVDEIDTGTLTRTRTLVSSIDAGYDIVGAAGALWMRQGSSNLLRISLIDGSVHTYGDQISSSTIAGDPSDTNTLIEYTKGVSPGTLARVDLSTDPPTIPVQQLLLSPPDSNLQDVAVAPDGASVIPAGSLAAPQAYSLSDLQPIAPTYPTSAFPRAVATNAASGGLLAIGTDVPQDAVDVYRLGNGSAPVATEDFGNAQEVEPAGMRFSPDGARLFTVTGDGGFQAPTDTFHVVTISGDPPTVRSLELSASSEQFGFQRVGTYGLGRLFSITNTGNADIQIDDLLLSGSDPVDFFGGTNCLALHGSRVLPAGGSCNVEIFFGALGLGSRSATLTVKTDLVGQVHAVALNGVGTEGYYLADARGQVANFGDASWVGSAGGHPLAAPVISVTTTPNGEGFWLLARDGGIFSYGNAAFHGSTGAIKLNKPIVGMAATPSGKGYWLVASDGGIFAFGDARFYGSTGAMHLNQPVVGMAATPSGHGYWLVASDGGIFSFGDAQFFGSTGAIRLNRPIAAMATSPTGRGYRFVASDGGIFSFGDARFYGSAAASGARIVALASTPDGRGYWMASSTGAVFHYGDAPFYGDARTSGATDVIGLAGTAPLIPPELLGATSAASPGGISLRDRSSTTLRARTG